MQRVAYWSQLHCGHAPCQAPIRIRLRTQFGSPNSCVRQEHARRNTEWNAHSSGGLAVGILASCDPIVILVYSGAVRVTRALILTIVWSSRALGNGQII